MHCHSTRDESNYLRYITWYSIVNLNFFLFFAFFLLSFWFCWGTRHFSNRRWWWWGWRFFLRFVIFLWFAFGFFGSIFKFQIWLNCLLILSFRWSISISILILIFISFWVCIIIFNVRHILSRLHWLDHWKLWHSFFSWLRLPLQTFILFSSSYFLHFFQFSFVRFILKIINIHILLNTNWVWFLSSFRQKCIKLFDNFGQLNYSLVLFWNIHSFRSQILQITNVGMCLNWYQ